MLLYICTDCDIQNVIERYQKPWKCCIFNYLFAFTNVLYCLKLSELVWLHLQTHPSLCQRQDFSGHFKCHIIASHTLTGLFAFPPLNVSCFLTGNDSGLISAHRWADPRQLSIGAHSSRGSEEKPIGGARGTLQAAGLWGEAPHGHHHSPQTERTPPQVPAVLPTSFPAAATTQLWNLRHSPGETHTTKSYVEH